ncbi:glycosyltransferase family 2 protein [Seonamhaeicola maritimus]|uniref:glycosyltransferase family 2 protein n=1 Tax=Seonamhaeicola maritimus TaxID=2591822 RepID=UPI0024954A41|nr:glycosyltransferase family A protein [Seonamhaeicola maritimus]
MPFELLKYLQPTQYFQLKFKSGEYIFPKSEFLPKTILSQIESDRQYKSDLSIAYDLSWQAIQKGYVGNAPRYNHFDPLPIPDNYRFLRKNFNKTWVFYVLILRLFSFKNPFKELGAYLNTRNVNRINYVKSALSYDAFGSFESGLLKRMPLVSVIIPTLNRYDYLKDVLRDLEQQTYTNFEVIIVDQTTLFQEDFYEGWHLNLCFWHQKDKALWRARNTAIASAKGDYILLYDDDSLIDPDWISAHLRVLDFFKADISSGISLSVKGAKTPENYSIFRVSDQIDTGNVLIKKTVFKKIGLFDEQFEKQRMGDGEFGLRAYLYGFLNISNPYANRIHLKAGTGGLRQMGSWDAFRPTKFFAPRPIPSVLYLYRRYFGKAAARLALLRTIPLSIFPYQFKKRKLLLILGVFVTLLLTPLVLCQVLLSWRLSGKKIKQGPLIETLE